jgi:hypothetical protein
MKRIATIARRPRRGKVNPLLAGVLALLYVAAAGLALAHDHAGESGPARACQVCRVAHTAAILPAPPVLAALQARELVRPAPCLCDGAAMLPTIRVRGPPSVDRTP